jgi:endonuclease YncB( thermonuclease family)
MSFRPLTAPRLALSALLVLLLVVSGLSQEPVTVRGKVVGTTDGDTIKVLVADRQLIKVRLAFIDSPEMHQAFGYRAKQAMSALVFGKEVELRPHTIDRYGRLVAIVYMDGTDAGLEMIRQGYAWCYDRYLPEASEAIQASYRQAQEGARTKQAGLWSDPDPIPPWEWRKTEKDRSRTIQPAAPSAVQ